MSDNATISNNIVNISGSNAYATSSIGILIISDTICTNNKIIGMENIGINIYRYNCIVENNIIIDCDGHSIQTTGDGSICDNQIINSGADGIYVSYDSDVSLNGMLIITGNTIDDATSEGINTYDGIVGYTIISDNIINNTGSFAVKCKDNTKIDNNFINNTGASAIYLHDGKDNSVTGNTIYDGVDWEVVEDANADENLITDNVFPTGGTFSIVGSSTEIYDNIGYTNEQNPFYTVEYDGSYFFNLTARLTPSTFLIPCFGTPPLAVNGQMYLDTGNYSLAIYYDGVWHWHEEV